MLFTFLWLSVGLGFREFFDGLYFLIPDAIALGSGNGIFIGGPTGLVLALLNFFVVQRKDQRERKEVGTANTGRKILKIFLSIIIVAGVDLVCIWMIMYAWGEFGATFLIFLAGGFLLLFVVFLVGVPILKTTVPVISHLFVFPVLFYLSGSFYMMSLERQYNSQFQSLQRIKDMEILYESMYREEWGPNGRYTRIKVFLVGFDQDAEELKRIIHQQIDVSSLQKVSDFSLLRRKQNATMLHKNDSPIQMTITKLDMGNVSQYPKYQELQDKLGENKTVLQKADYLIEFHYEVEPSGSY